MITRDELHAKVDHDQGWHSPIGPYVGDHLAAVRAKFTATAHWTVDACPPNEHLQRALALIDEAQMYAIKACITQQEDLRPPEPSG